MNSPLSDDNATSPPATPRRRPPKPASKRRTKRTRPVKVEETEVELRYPAAGTMARTRRLILAALRVWELKRGLRDY